MEELRSSLIPYAYNITGSWEESKDIVHDVLLKFSQMDQDEIKNEKAYLVRMVVNLSIDHKRKQKKHLSDYPGNWLPEPVATDDPHTTVYRKEILSYTVMVLLEKLDPKQRAVFILKEAFDYDHADIARVLGISVENSRKILNRAKNELRLDSAPKVPEKQSAMLRRFLAVLESGDMAELERLLHEQVNVVSDGGGKVPAFRNIIRGARSVSALLTGLYKKTFMHVDSEITWINHQPAILLHYENTLVTCQIFSIEGDQVDHVFIIRNPDKLAVIEK